ncbi:hypothetical protein LAB1_23770 [Roseibium sp. LAB1]
MAGLSTGEIMGARDNALQYGWVLDQAAIAQAPSHRLNFREACPSRSFVALAFDASLDFADRKLSAYVLCHSVELSRLQTFQMRLKLR